MQRMQWNNFYSRRWQGRVPTAVLVWRDMLGVGTVINLGGTMLAMAVIVNDLDAWLAVALHLAPLPHNVFLLAAVQRAVDRDPLTSLIAGIWFVVTVIV